MNILSTWKKTAYRQSSAARAQAPLSEHLIGGFELTDTDLEVVQGAGGGLNLLNGNDILDGNNILNGAASNNGIGILGIGSSSDHQGQGRGRSQDHGCGKSSDKC